jgi:hypothetical protein
VHLDPGAEPRQHLGHGRALGLPVVGQTRRVPPGASTSSVSASAAGSARAAHRGRGTAPSGPCAHQRVLVLHQQDAAMVDHRDPVGHRLGFLDVVGGQHDRGARAAGGRGPPPTCPCAARHRPRRWARRETGPWAHGQRLGDQHPALHAARELAGLGASRLSHSESCRRIVSMRSGSGRRPNRPRENRTVLPPSQRARARFPAAPGRSGAGRAELAERVVTAHGDRPAGGADQAANDRDQRRLARAVGAEQRQDLAVVDVQRLEAAVILLG